MTSTTSKPTINSSTNWSTITEEFAKKLGVEIIGNSHESQNNYGEVSCIVKQVLSKKIQISLHRLLGIEPEIQQDIINAIVNPNITEQRSTK
ncbi:7149_t:CDS:2 [Acaulospora colombiana]|uniref:7149_t:CDS:1 n=1 Tax=Acaulospora colombiana TaxID=27376 RepID=A0ACA9L846_9GLOM|nr:7149_t:CDS:2 [Acaulospora colombiana]